MKTIHGYSRYGAIVGVFAEWHPIVFKIVTALASGRDVGMAYLIKFTTQTIAELGEKGQVYKEGENDIISSLLAKHRKSPEIFTMEDVHHHVLPNVVGGAETTGITLSAAVYFLWKNPQILSKLRQELDAREPTGKARDIMTAKDAAGCRYLQAVIKETLRLHPGNGLGLTRLVPKGGLTLSGRYFPEGVCLLFLTSHMTDEKQERLTILAGGGEYKCLRSSCQPHRLRRGCRFIPPGTLASGPRKSQSDG